MTERAGWFARHPVTEAPVHVVTREWFDETRAEVAEARRLENKWHTQWLRQADRAEAAEAEVRRLREAIADALADMTPGFAPYSLLSEVLSSGVSGDQP